MPNLSPEETFIHKQHSLANFLEISCKNRNFFHTTYTSKQVTRQGVRGQMPFGINVRSMISFREKGHSAMERVFGLMNFVPIMNFDSYNEVSANVACSYSNVAQACMMEAAEELKGGSTDEDLLCNVVMAPSKNVGIPYYLEQSQLYLSTQVNVLIMQVCDVYILGVTKRYRRLRRILKYD